ncbi:MAG: hypothetical protein LUD84_03570 [Clostridiales bacterium]|nr:hypothetical protein [Clostridiales bacterium]
MDYSEYHDLTPIDDIENGEEYINALTWAFNNKKITNIALAGPYGSGKSSVIEAFLKDNKKTRREKDNAQFKEKIYRITAYFRKKMFPREYLKISLASFVEGHQQSTEGKIIELDSDEIEEGILKQLFYKVKPRKIPQSRYRKLRTRRFVSAVFGTLLVTLFIGLLCAIFVPSACDYLVNSLQNFVQDYCPMFINTYILAAVLYFAAVFAIAFAYYFAVVSRIKVKEIKLPTDTTFKAEEDDDRSIFNKNLDEIMYFFEATSYRTVFFEDLDRLDDKKIFVHLRELNNLLNNDDSIKRKPIVFVYAVKDDLFSEEDRTKFFDFIIPVIPVINSTNSGEVLLERLRNAQSHGIIHDISDDFVLDVSPYISDMRILLNIYNEFVVYKRVLKKAQGLDLSDEKMLALIIFKNLYPSDFADIQKERGIIKKAFLDKATFIETQKDSLQAEIDEITRKISIANADALQSVREIKIAMLVTLAAGKGITKFISVNRNGSQNNLSLFSTRILDDTFNLSELTKRNYQGVTYIAFSNSSSATLAVEDYESVVAPFIDRCEARKELSDKGIEGLQSEIQQLKEKQRRLSSLTLRELIAEYPDCTIVSGQNKFLAFLLRRGYIDEKYSTYINYFKGATITNDDMNFILAVKNREAKPFDYKLTKTEVIIQRLQNYEFKQKEVYNFDLLDQLLSQASGSEKLAILIKQLADESEASWKFIDEFVDKTAHLDQFIKLLAGQWKRMWLHITLDATLTYGRQIQYLVNLIRVLTPKELSLQNEDGCLVKFFEDHSDILQRLEKAGCADLEAIIEEVNLFFRRLKLDGVSNDLQSFIFTGHYYELNWSMVQNIVAFNDRDSLVKLKEQPYSTVVSLNYKPLIEDVHKNIARYTREIILAQKSICDSIEDILALLEQLIDHPDLCTDLIVKEKFYLDNLGHCCLNLVDQHSETVKKIWIAILSENKIEISWENVIIFWEEWSLENSLRDYITSNIDKLIVTPTDTVADEFIADFIKTDFPEEVKRKALSVLRMEEFPLEIEELDEVTLKILIEYRYFDFTASRFSSIYKVDVRLSIEFIMLNQKDFIDNLTEIEMTPELFEQVLLDTRLDDDIRRDLFGANASKYMTPKIAAQMNQESLGLHITAEIFHAAWGCLDDSGKETLMYRNLCMLEAEDLESCFTDLGGEYNDFLDRSRRHEVSLSNSENHMRLVERLEKVGYITSYLLKDNPLSEMMGGEQIKCRIKQIKQEDKIDG